jgi:Protein of unknown function (DUF2971)
MGAPLTANSLPPPIPPDVLFHYTSQSGFLGILASKEIWATKIQYLNDYSEFQLALDSARDVLAELHRKEPDGARRSKIECLLASLSSITLLNVCVASFSADGDLLSQWRAYASEGGGCAIGFDSAALVARAREYKFTLVKCVYEQSQHEVLIKTLVDGWLAKDFNMQQSYIDPARPCTIVALRTGGDDFAADLAKLAPSIKNGAFSEENEWRLVSSGGIDVRKLSFRPGTSMVAPYFPLPLGDDRSSYVKTVTVGPAPHSQLAQSSVRSVLAHWNTNVDTKISKVPYRIW